MNFILSILAIIIFILLFILEVRYTIEYLRQKTKLTLFLLILIASFGFSVGYDAFKIFHLFFLGNMFEFSDKIFFIGQGFFVLIGFIALGLMNFNLLKESGHPSKFQQIMEIFYFFSVPILTVINIYTLYGVFVPELNTYWYYINPILYILMGILFLPLSIYLMVKSRNYLKEIKRKEIVRHIELLGILFTAFCIERFVRMGQDFIVTSFNINWGFSIDYIIQFSVIIGLLSMFILIIFVNPQYLEITSIYFSVQSIYIIKESGQALYKYEFHKHKMKNEAFSTDQFLLGGFIHAIASGLQHSLGLEGKIRRMEIGNINAIFKHGKQVFCVLFTTECNKTIENKLNEFLIKFEGLFSSHLNEWTGNISKFMDNKEIEKWVLDIFR